MNFALGPVTQRRPGHPGLSFALISFLRESHSMTRPTAIKRSSTPVSPPQVPVDKGSATAQKVDKVLSRNPKATQAFIFKGLGAKVLSTMAPPWFKGKKEGGPIAIGNTQQFFRDLGIESLFHPNPSVREAAELVAKPAVGSGPYELTPEIRAAVRTLADPSSDALQRYREERKAKDQFLSDTGFGKNLIRRAQEKLTSGPVTASEGPLAALDADEPVPAFQPALPHELQKQYDKWRKAQVTAAPELDAAVTAYAHQTYGGGSPFEPRSPAGRSVSNLLTYITTGTEKEVVKGGREIQALNGFHGITFGSRTEALHHLLWNTPFLVRVPPTEANRFMKLYNELAKARL